MDELRREIIDEIDELRALICPNATKGVVDAITTDKRIVSYNETISEEDFRHWLSQKVKNDGQPLSTTYQNAYYYILKAIPSMLGFENVFLITDIDSFKQYRQRVEASTQYQETNPNLGVGILSSALTNYGKYLEERTMINIPTERLVQILKDWYTKKYVENNITSTLVGFGFKYARALNKANISARAIMELAQIESTMQAYIDRGKDLYFAIEKANIGFEFVQDKKEPKQTLEIFKYSTTKNTSTNKIFYGVPGCGKSHHIEHTVLGKDNNTKQYIESYEKDNIIRTTFYQDYSNTDFVGQILPKVVKGENGEKDTVEYIFNPGPFTLALVQAIKSPDKKVALVIEEINRGNAPAIFGDIFQLLDRDENSISEYGIVNVSMMDYLKTVNFGTKESPVYYKFDEIKIPGNMDIFATMNTSDQNVYTLDTAFTRRWEKKHIPNKFNEHKIKDMLVPGMEQYTWGVFVDAINGRIKKNLESLQVNEDKQVGVFFVKDADLLEDGNTLSEDKKKDKAESFAYKVLEYLWGDVSKLDHSVIFNSTYMTFEELVEGYLDKGVEIFNSKVFEDKPVRNTAKTVSKEAESAEATTIVADGETEVYTED